MPSIIVFPGQGSQFVGMGKKLLNVNKVNRMFELASETFKVDLLKMCLNGPQSELNKTVNCQAAVFVTSIAAVEYLKETNPNSIKDCYATAGFSVGEYASLVLAGSLTFEDALRVLKVRSEAMQSASEQIPSGLMTAILNRKSNLNLAMLAARKWCKEQLKLDEPIECQIANYLSSQVKVIGGNKQALDFIEVNQKEFDIVKLKILPVSGAFHTKLMKPAQDSLKKILKDVYIKKPLIKFYSNYDAESISSPDRIKINLIKQVSNPVKWEQILNKFFYDENLPILEENGNENEIDKNVLSPNQSKNRVYPEIYECGPGSQTGPVLKIINRKAHQLYKHIDV